MGKGAWVFILMYSSFTKQDGKMKKKVCYTSSYQCDQEIPDTLSIAAIVFD